MAGYLILIDSVSRDYRGFERREMVDEGWSGRIETNEGLGYVKYANPGFRTPGLTDAGRLF